MSIWQSNYPIWAFHSISGRTAYSTTWDSKRDTEEIKAACRHHVRSADSKAPAAIEKRSRTFAAFIESRKAGATPFSTAIVSFYGKWRAVKSYLPFVPKDDHRNYVEELFARHIFSVSEIAAAMRQAIEGSIKDLDGIENELAVALRQEILGRSLAPDEIPIAAENFKRAIEQMVKASQFDAAKTVGSLIVSEVAAQLTTQVILRLGVSAGIPAYANQMAVIPNDRKPGLIAWLRSLGKDQASVRLDWHKRGQLTLSHRDANGHSSSMQVPVEIHGSPPVIAFNARFLADALQIGGTLCLSDKLSPGICRHPTGRFAVVMPMRVTIPAITNREIEADPSHAAKAA